MNERELPYCDTQGKKAALANQTGCSRMESLERWPEAVRSADEGFC